MLDKEGKERAWSQFYGLFIEPELEKRSTIAWSDIYKVLIKLPKDTEPVVEFNNEVSFIYAVEDPVARNAGAALEYHEIRAIGEILPPKVDDRYVAFIYAWRTGDHIKFTFDFRPNSPDFDENEYKLGDALSMRLYYEFIEVIMPSVFEAHERLAWIGLPLCPELIPFPLNKIVKYICDNDQDAASKLIEEHCDNAFLEELVQNWYKFEMPRERKTLYDQALKTHSYNLYVVTINALMGEFEGIITDWLFRNLGEEAKQIKEYSGKFQKFKDIMETVIPSEKVEHLIFRSICEFLVSPETILQKFYIRNWNDPVITKNNPSRHIIQHGKYIPEYYTRTNSVKMFLVIHSIYWCIYCYETYKRDIRQEQL